MDNHLQTSNFELEYKTENTEEKSVPSRRRRPRIPIEQASSLEDIVDTMGELLVSFLSEEDKARFMSASDILNNYYFIPLDLYKINLSYEDFVIYFGNRPEVNLIGLNISFTQIDNDLSPLLPFLPRLQTLYLGNQSGTYFDINFLSRCKQLKGLELNLSETSLESLPDCVKLEKLDIRTDKLVKTGLRPLINCFNLKILFLEDIEVVSNNGQYAFNPLSQLKNLERLDIIDVSTFTSIPSLKRCSYLKEINIFKCENLVNISGVEGCIFLEKYRMEYCPDITDFEPLASCIGLVYLILESGLSEGVYPELRTNLFYEAINLNQLVVRYYTLHYNSSFKHWNSLRELSLCHIQGNPQIPSLPKITLDYSGLETLHLVGCDLIEIRGLKMCKELKIIEITDCKNITNVDFIASCPKLVILNIINCPITSFEFLRKCLNLETVFIKNTELSDLRVFEEHSKIIKIGLDDTKIISFEGLEKCSLIKEICAQRTPLINLDNLEYFPLLTHLHLNGCIRIDDFTPLSLCSNLVYLDMWGTRIKSLKPLEKAQKLIMLDVSNCAHLGLVGINKIVNLRRLYLDNWPAIYLEPLLQLKNIVKISVKGTPIRDEEEDLAAIDLSESNLNLIIISDTEAYVNRNRRLVKKEGEYAK
jgi:hypothetical protein